MKKAPARKANNNSLRFHPLFSVTTFFLGILAMFVIQQVFAHGGNTNYIHSCIHKGDGSLRVIDANSSCKPEETPLDWNIQGPPGQVGPQGPAGNGYFGLPFFCDNCALNQFATKFQGRDFTQANITRSFLDHVNLSQVIFKGGNFDGTIFTGSDLTGADLSNIAIPPFAGGTQVTMTDANLTNTNLSNDTFRGSDFNGANLTNTNFSNSSFTNTKFKGAQQMSTANLSGTTWDNTVCPDGTNSDNNGHTCVGHF